jgi:septal ring factor EnvC (AmiA/AmiB activator)
LLTLNWRRDPGYEQRKLQHELRMKQLESEILRVRSDSERIARETKQIEKETEQLSRENARQRALSALIEQHCFTDDSNSIPLPPTEPGSSSS